MTSAPVPEHPSPVVPEHPTPVPELVEGSFATRRHPAPVPELVEGPFPTIDPFGAKPVPGGVDVVSIPATVGTLTAFHAAPARGTTPRGTVLIVPGFTGSKEDFTDFLPRLSAAGWDAWAYSQRGQADSVGPVGLEHYRLEDFAADAVEVAQLVGGGAPVHLLGHSFGGVVARAAAIASPSSFRSLTMFCSGPSGWEGRHQDTIDTLEASGSIGLWYRDNPHTLGVPDSGLSADEAFVRLRAERTSSDNLRSAAVILRDDRDTTELLHATGLPVHVVHGEHDDAWPIPWQHYMALRLEARYSVIAGAAHSPQLEAPALAAEALDAFWASVPLAPAAP
ncbi:alpha/beta fold hydrolase [Plantibacter sp. Mn2098]|uniref:alpha/beta fold hydrolase n=1 Tax=Plantibacter sp. Mn2098 TaxID=3395266 RepID=UPI003BED632D